MLNYKQNFVEIDGKRYYLGAREAKTVSLQPRTEIIVENEVDKKHTEGIIQKEEILPGVYLYWLIVPKV